MEYLVAVDASEEAQNALAYAADLADVVGSSITVVHAADPYVHEEGGLEPISTFADADERLIVESLVDAEQRGLDILEDAETAASDLGHEVETRLLYGDPVSEICEYADSGEFDAIFLGHRGRSERAGFLVGSVAKGVVERATVPVTVVR